jgi:pSer/pThr/pTyr-binding forkhead associated (FHA) protein
MPYIVNDFNLHRFNSLNAATNKQQSNQPELITRQPLLSQDVFVSSKKQDSFNKELSGANILFGGIFKKANGNPDKLNTPAQVFEYPAESHFLHSLSMFKPATEPGIIRCDGELNTALMKMKRGQYIKIGRGPDNQYINTEKTVSAKHAIIARGLDGNLYIIDRKSTNGTYINSTAIVPDKPHRILPEDNITLTRNIPLNIYPEVLTRPPVVKVDKTAHPAISNEISVQFKEMGEIYAGRIPSNDCINISYDDTMSRKHAKFTFALNGLFLEDNNSTNGTFVNRKRINQVTKLNHNDKLKMGNNIYVYDDHKKILYTLTGNSDTFYKYFPQSLDNLDFEQSSELGDCYFLAALKSITENPKAVRYLANMIEDLPDGHTKVKFFGCPSEMLLSGDEVRQIIADKGVKGQAGIKLIERAYGKLIKPLRMMENPGEENTFLLMNGGHSTDVMSAMVPCSSRYIGWDTFMGDTSILNYKKDELKAVLTAFVNNRENTLLCAATKLEKDGDNSDRKILYETPDGMKIAIRHAYTIKDVDLNRETITIINPWHAKKESEISFDDFFKYFRGFYQGILKSY